MMWKDFFYFTKTERQGIIILAVLIIGVCIASKLISSSSTEKSTNAKEKEKFEKEYKDFITSLQEVKPTKKYSKNNQYASYPNRKVILSSFDPNTADSTTFLDLGLPPWMIKNIIKYRNKQGKFRHPNDFKRIYGLTEEKYNMLLPYINIAEEYSKKDTIRLLIERKEKRDTLFKYQPGTIVDLNSADTTELKKIPGIGSSIAKMIVGYRTRLGGFYKIEQLKEIDLKAEKLRAWFSINTDSISRINLNRASFNRMIRHPYINYEKAKTIINHREKKRRLKSLDELSLYDEFTPEYLDKVRPYVCFE